MHSDLLGFTGRMSFALLASKHLIRRAAASSFVSANACRTLVCTPNNNAKLGTGKCTSTVIREAFFTSRSITPGIPCAVSHAFLGVYWVTKAAFRRYFLVIWNNTVAVYFTAPQPVTSGLLPSYHWTIERVIAVSMLPMYPIALIYEPYLMEYVVSAAVSLHAYW